MTKHLLKIYVATIVMTAGMGCGGPHKVPTAELMKSHQVSAKVASRDLQSYRGPKIRVAVGEIKDFDAAMTLYSEMGWVGIGPSLSDQITTGLVQTRRVVVLERQQLEQVIGNLKLEKEGESAKYFDQSTTKSSGQFLGAQAVLLGAVTEFEPNVGGAESGIQLGSVGGLKYHADKAVVGLDVRLVDQESGRVLTVGNGRGVISTSSLDGGISYLGLEVGGQSWSKTPIGAATREAANQALAQLIEGLADVAWEGRVVGASGRKCFIDAGKDLNLSVGDEFDLFLRGEAIRNRDGAILGYDESRIGRVRVTSVQQKMSIAKLLEGRQVEKGMIVRFPIQP